MDRLSEILLQEDCAEDLWSSVESGEMDDIIPELSRLEMEQDPIHKHKDVLAHTIAVVNKTKPDIVVRLAALFHDIGKPDTRSFSHGGVTFRHHEEVGSRIARKRLKALDFPEEIVQQVSELVRLSGRFKGDSAVRRYARDAGPLLGKLNHLIRCDCTTRNRAKEEGIQAAMDDLETRIKDLAEEERIKSERPGLDGDEIMQHLGLEPGKEVGEALKFLLEIKRKEGDLDREELEERLNVWWSKRD